MKKNNKGYSLFELLIAMAIFSIVMLAIIMMMRTTVASYKDGLFETSMQQEAQIVANQVSDLLVDATYYSATNSNVAGAKQYTFYGVGNQPFMLSQAGNILYYYEGTDSAKAVDPDQGAQVLSDQLDPADGFSIEGLSRRASESDKTTNFDNQVTVKINILSEDQSNPAKNRSYSAIKDTYFRNDVENRYGMDDLTTPYTIEGTLSPFDANGGSISGGGPAPDDVDDYPVLRYQAFDISKEYDIVYEGQLVDHTGTFTYEELANTWITHPISGKTPQRYVIKVNATYCSPTTSAFGHDTTKGDTGVYFSGLNSKGEAVTVRLYLDAVDFDNGSGIFEEYNEADVNQNGYPNHVKVYGLNLNNALTDGMKVKYDIALYRGSTKLGEATDVELKANTHTYADTTGSNMPQLGSFDFKLGVVADPLSSGFIISSANGYRVSQKGGSVGTLNNDTGNQKLTVKFKIFDGANFVSHSNLDLNYKFYLVGNSLKNA